MSMFDACLHYKYVDNIHVFMLLDEILFVSPDIRLLNVVKAEFNNEFEMKNSEEASKIWYIYN